MTKPKSHARPGRPKWVFLGFGMALCVMLVTVAMFLYGLTLEDTWRVSESILIDAAPAEVAGRIVNPSEWTEWSMWSAANDPTLETKTSGPDLGPKATLQWAGRGLGRGKLVMTDVSKSKSDPETWIIRYDLYRHGELFSDEGKFELTAQGDQTRVVWTDSGELGSTTGRIFRTRFMERISSDYARCLEQLEDAVEQHVQAASAEEPPPP